MRTEYMKKHWKSKGEENTEKMRENKTNDEIVVWAANNSFLSAMNGVYSLVFGWENQFLSIDAIVKQDIYWRTHQICI